MTRPRIPSLEYKNLAAFGASPGQTQVPEFRTRSPPTPFPPSRDAPPPPAVPILTSSPQHPSSSASIVAQPLCQHLSLRAFKMATASPVSFLDSLPRPTLDRPFGIHLWPIFSKAFEAVAGYPAEEFRFVPGETPMSTLKETSIFIVIYYTIIFGGRELMRNREPFKLRTLFLIHNFYLTAISAILLALFIEQLLPIVVRGGIFHAICHIDGGWTQPLVVLYYVCCGSPPDAPLGSAD